MGVSAKTSENITQYRLCLAVSTWSSPGCKQEFADWWTVVCGNLFTANYYSPKKLENCSPISGKVCLDCKNSGILWWTFGRVRQKKVGELWIPTLKNLPGVPVGKLKTKVQLFLNLKFFTMKVKVHFARYKFASQTL